MKSVNEESASSFSSYKTCGSIQTRSYILNMIYKIIFNSNCWWMYRECTGMILDHPQLNVYDICGTVGILEGAGRNICAKSFETFIKCWYKSIEKPKFSAILLDHWVLCVECFYYRWKMGPLLHARKVNAIFFLKHKRIFCMPQNKIYRNKNVVHNRALAMRK